MSAKTNVSNKTAPFHVGAVFYIENSESPKRSQRLELSNHSRMEPSIVTEFIVPQLEPFCKVQNNPKVNATIRQYSQTPDPYHRQCARILAIGNDAAVEFLQKLGFTQVIPGTHFAPLYDVADFFGIRSDSLYAYLTRHGFGANHDPRESITEDLASFFRRSGLIRHGKFVKGCFCGDKPIEGVFDFRFTGTEEHYVTKYRYSGRLFTARA